MKRKNQIKKNNKKYLEKLLKIKGDWFSYEDYRKIRAEVENKLKNR